MDSAKIRPPEFINPADVAPLPSAPPPSYDDAMSSSNTYGGPSLQQSVPLMSGNQPYNPAPGATIQSPYPAGQLPPQPYPVQQVQVAHVVAPLPSRHLPVGRYPLKTTCTGCNTSICTKIKTKNNCHPTFWCIVLFMTGLLTLCSCCPYFFCNKPCKVDHYCPKCNAFLGTYYEAN